MSRDDARPVTPLRGALPRRGSLSTSCVGEALGPFWRPLLDLAIPPLFPERWTRRRRPPREKGPRHQRVARLRGPFPWGHESSSGREGLFQVEARGLGWERVFQGRVSATVVRAGGLGARATERGAPFESEDLSVRGTKRGPGDRWGPRMIGREGGARGAASGPVGAPGTSTASPWSRSRCARPASGGGASGPATSRSRTS